MISLAIAHVLAFNIPDCPVHSIDDESLKLLDYFEMGVFFLQFFSGNWILAANVT